MTAKPATVNGTTTNVEDGQTVTINIDGTDYTTTVTGNAWSITGIDLSAHYLMAVQG